MYFPTLGPRVTLGRFPRQPYPPAGAGVGVSCGPRLRAPFWLRPVAVVVGPGVGQWDRVSYIPRARGPHSSRGQRDGVF